MSKAKPEAAPEKSASELLIERLAEKELKASVNPLAVVKDEKIERKSKSKDPQVVRAKTFANGAVVETYA